MGPGTPSCEAARAGRSRFMILGGDGALAGFSGGAGDFPEDSQIRANAGRKNRPRKKLAACRLVGKVYGPLFSVGKREKSSVAQW